ncbi:tetratricopeptide repeat protein [Vulgatibacter sp.]|uniref:tetratricopeptide repeat protein n=1 Tax=Vulgatibacter sp. TaxID=1971226 RepID=UPI003568213D
MSAFPAAARAAARTLLLTLLFVLPAQAWAAADERMAAAEEALSAWDMPKAVSLAEALYGENPSDPRSAFLLGRVKLHTGDYEGAARLLEDAGAPGTPGGYLDVARRTQAITANYQQVESKNFVFRYPAGKDEILAPWALETLEASYEQIGDVVGFKPSPADGKILVEVVADAEELSAVSTLGIEAIKTTGTIAVCKFNKLMITSPKALLRGYEWRDTLAHEYVHLVITKKSRNQTPIWLHEGMAKYLETAWRGPPGKALELPSEALLRDAVKAEKLITFEQMHPSIALLPTARDAALAFAEVFSAIEYLHGADATSVERILSHLGAGLSDRDAVAKVYGKPFAVFERSWRHYLQKRPYPQENASVALLEKHFADEQPEAPQEPEKKNAYRDLTELSEFRAIKDARARKAAHLGELLRARGKFAAAAAKYEEAVARAGAQFPNLSNKYALALLELGEHGSAVRVLESTRDYFPNDVFTNLNLARAKMQSGKVRDAEPFLRTAVSVNPFDPEVHGRLLAVAKETGDADLLQRSSRALALLTGAVPGQQSTEQRP